MSVDYSEGAIEMRLRQASQLRGLCLSLSKANSAPANLLAQFDRVTELWSPKVVARVNDSYIKVAKVKGEFVWHKHDGEDELFFIIKGSLRIQMQGGGEVTLREGELFVVPKDTMHNPVADEECWLMLIEPVSTKHTGDVETDRTRSIDEQLR